jgi:hypothetical protein
MKPIRLHMKHFDIDPGRFIGTEDSVSRAVPVAVVLGASQQTQVCNELGGGLYELRVCARVRGYAPGDRDRTPGKQRAMHFKWSRAPMGVVKSPI